MDLQEKLKAVVKEIEVRSQTITETSLIIKELKRVEKGYLKLIEKAKALEQK